LRRLALVIVALVGLAAGQAAAAGPYAETQHFAFVGSRGDAAVSVIDIAEDRLAGRIALPLVAAQLAVSTALPRLLAVDGQSPSLALAKLDAGSVAAIPLDFPARRLLLGPDGRRAAVSDLAGGHIAVFDVASGAAVASFNAVGAIRDLMFAKDGEGLIVATDSLRLLRSGQPPQVLGGTLAGGPLVLARSADGRQVFVHAAAGRELAMIDPDGVAPAQSIAADGLPVPTGTGAYLLLLDPEARRVAVVHGGETKPAASFTAAPGAAGAYSAWFDSVAFVPSRGAASVAVYDLWRLSAAGSIALPAVAGPGAVTADGAKLYLPLPEAGQVAVIDGRTHRLTRLIDIGHPPVVVAVAGAFGLCH